MSTLNVRDYGAEGDGQTDDTDAIQQAIEDASAGDTVFIPATEESYLVSASNRAAVDFTTVADDVTISGEGIESRLRMANTRDDRNQWVLGAEADKGTISGVTITQLTLDGNRTENGNTSTSGFNMYPGGSGHSVRIEDVLIENSAGSGMNTSGTSTLTLRRVTSRNNGRHGFDFSGTIDARSIKSTDNDGTGLDFHRGDHHVEDVYCDNNRSGTKLGATGGTADSVVLRNANLRNARGNSGFRETMPDGDGTTVTLDTVQVVSPSGDCFRLTDAADYEITEILAHNSGSRYSIRIADSATVNAETIRSQYADGGDGTGLRNGSSGSVSIGEYYHYETNRPIIDRSGTMTVGSETERESEFLDVPEADDVGAFTRSDPVTESEETYVVDFSFSEIGTTPAGWSPKYASSNDDWRTVSESSPRSSALLRFSSENSTRHALSYDEIGSASDVDILSLFRVTELSQNPTSGGRLILRGSGSDGSESGYFLNVRDERFGIWRYVDGDSDRLSEWGSPDESQWYFGRFRADGEQLRARVWPHEEDEPDSWDADVTDGALSGGWIGVGSFSEFVDEWGFVSIGVGGATAPLPDRIQHSHRAVIKTVDGTIQTGL